MLLWAYHAHKPASCGDQSIKQTVCSRLQKSIVDDLPMRLADFEALQRRKKSKR